MKEEMFKTTGYFHRLCSQRKEVDVKKKKKEKPAFYYKWILKVQSVIHKTGGISMSNETGDVDKSTKGKTRKLLSLHLLCARFPPSIKSVCVPVCACVCACGVGINQHLCASFFQHIKAQIFGFKKRHCLSLLVTFKYFIHELL